MSVKVSTRQKRQERKNRRRAKNAAALNSAQSRRGEPSWDGIGEDSKLNARVSTALSWYKGNSNDRQQKFWFLSYVEAHGDKKSVSTLAEVSEDRFYPYGGLCRMIELGCPMPERYVKKLEDKIEELHSFGQSLLDAKKKKKKEGPKPKEEKKPKLVVDRAVCQVVEELEAQVDSFLDDRRTKMSGDSAFDKIMSLNLSAKQIEEVSGHFKSQIDDYRAYLEKDEEIKEAYSHLKLSEIKKLAGFFDTVMDRLSKFQSKKAASKVSRKRGRSRKVKTPSMQVSKLNYLEKYKGDGLDLKSIDPRDFIGASQLWYYNTKRRHLGVLVSLDAEGLTVKGSTVYNLDPVASKSKRLRPNHRAPAIKEVLDTGKVGLRKVMDKYSAAAKVQELGAKARLNNNCVLLRAVK